MNDWEERFKQIRSIQIPKITDMLLEAEYSLSQMDYKGTIYSIDVAQMNDGTFEINESLFNENFWKNPFKDDDYDLDVEDDFGNDDENNKSNAKKENKFILISDQYFTSKMINYTNNIENLNFTSDLLLNLTQKDFLIELKNKSTENYAFTKVSNISQLAYLSVLSIFLTIFIPVIIIICVLIITKIYNRKKKI